MDSQPKIKRESKRKIRVEFERTSLKERLKTRFLSTFFLKRVVWYIFRLLLLIGIAFVVLQPFITMIIKSFMAPADFTDPTVVQVPRTLSHVIYQGVIEDLGYFKAFFNTMGLSLACALLQTFSACLVGYGLAKFKFRGNKIVFFAVVLTMVIPHGTLQTAMFVRFRYFDILGIFRFFSGNASTGIGFVDNILSKIRILPGAEQGDLFYGGGLNLIGTIAPFLIMSIFCLAFKNGLYVFLLRQFFRGVPDELEESAYLDGAGTFRTFFQVILPLSIPMMVTVFLFAFCWQWTDDFYIPLFWSTKAPNLVTNLTDNIVSSPILSNAKDLAQGQGSYTQAIKYGIGMLACTPLIILFLFCQRYLVQGIERSGITG